MTGRDDNRRETVSIFFGFSLLKINSLSGSFCANTKNISNIFINPTTNSQVQHVGVLICRLSPYLS